MSNTPSPGLVCEPGGIAISVTLCGGHQYLGRYISQIEPDRRQLTTNAVLREYQQHPHLSQFTISEGTSCGATFTRWQSRRCLCINFICTRSKVTHSSQAGRARPDCPYLLDMLHRVSRAVPTGSCVIRYSKTLHFFCHAIQPLDEWSICSGNRYQLSRSNILMKLKF